MQNKHLNFYLGEITYDDIGQSTSSKVYFSKTKDNKYVIKVFYNFDQGKQEVEILKQLESVAKVPKILFFSAFDNNPIQTRIKKKCFVYVSSFVDGVNAFDLSTKNEFEIMFESLKKFHDLSIQTTLPELSVDFIVQDITAMHKNGEISQEQLCYFINNKPNYQKAFLHGDCTLANILYKNQDCFFIDLSNARQGDIYYDILLMIESLKYNEQVEYLQMFLNAENVILDTKKLTWFAEYYSLKEQRKVDFCV